MQKSPIKENIFRKRDGVYITRRCHGIHTRRVSRDILVCITWHFHVIHTVSFAEYVLFYRALLQKRLMISHTWPTHVSHCIFMCIWHDSLMWASCVDTYESVMSYRWRSQNTKVKTQMLQHKSQNSNVTLWLLHVWFKTLDTYESVMSYRWRSQRVTFVSWIMCNMTHQVCHMSVTCVFRLMS